jgi:diacylglycerol kinase (ATP)
MNKKVLIILNPNSGTQFSMDIHDHLAPLLEHDDYDCDIEYTKGPMHALDLAKEAADQNYFAVLAVGGDGTVNEVGAALMHTDTALGIIPTGSGNGLARHMKYHMHPKKATEQILNSQSIAIDVCEVNKQPFFNVAGVGFDALVAHDFSLKPHRGFLSYLGSALKFWLSIGDTKYKLKLDGHKISPRALMITFANGSQFGNNATIAPDASLTDGYFQVCLLKKFPTYLAPIMAYRLFSGRIPNSKYLKVFRAKKVNIKRKRKKVHLDGEPFRLSKQLKVRVVPKALNILAPQEYFKAYGKEHPLR